MSHLKVAIASSAIATAQSAMITMFMALFICER